MIVGSTSGFTVSTGSMKPNDAAKATGEVNGPRSAHSSAQFAAFLTMIVGNDPTLRSNLIRQLPGDGVGLLDQILASSDGGADTMSDMPGAVDAVRYGMLTPDTARTSSSSAIVEQTNTLVEPNSPKGAVDSNGINAPNAQNRMTPAVLARIASGKMKTVGEALAIGDTDAATVRAGLDVVLAKSGTEEGLALAANHAANTALSQALAASASDTTTPIRDVEALDPELRARLGRVIDRMKYEYGHDVSIVETARSQERQNTLYEQGRTAPGSVVTWTQDSAHTHGAAADVIVDGSWNNGKGFARLQQIAKEEGIRTIDGDPGHMELPKADWTLNSDVRVMSATSTSPVQAPVNNGIARVATVARVASVGAGLNIKPTIPEMPQPGIAAAGAVGVAPQQRDANNSNSQSSSESGSERTPRKSSLKGADGSDARANTAAYQETPTDLKTRFIGPTDETQRPTGASAAEAVDRVQDINALREQQGAKPLSQLTLEVDGPNGPSQIKVDVRGNTVSTDISTDSVSAGRLRANSNELRTGLESRGLESDSVRISTQGTRATDAADAVKSGASVERDAMRLTGPSNGGSTTTGDSSSQQGARDKSSTARDWEEKQSAREEQRAQHRDAQGRGSGNQDRQRPQYQEKQ